MRRAPGAGSVIVRKSRADGPRKYYGKWTTADGRQVKKVLGPVRSAGASDGITRKEAEARLRDEMQKTVRAAPAERITFARAGEAYLAAGEERRKRSSQRYVLVGLTKWLNPHMGDRTLDAIEAEDIEDLIRKMRKGGLANKTIRNYMSLASAVFLYSMNSRRRWATRNPVAEVDLPANPQSAEIRYLTPDEVRTLVAAAQPGDYQAYDRALYTTAAMTGLRIGELSALCWSDVDWTAGRVRVRLTYDRIGKKDTAPKSRRSQRSVPLSADVGGELERMLRSLYGDAEPSPDALVFGDPVVRGRERLLYQAALDRLRLSLAAAKLDKAHGFHSLRHSFGTAMAANGVPMRTLQEWMGHRDITTTQIYADYSPSPHETAWVEEAFRGTSVVLRGRSAAEPSMT